VSTGGKEVGTGPAKKENKIMEILENFGIDWMLTLGGIINFLIILFVLKKFLYKPVFEMLKKREDAIKEGLAKADESQKALDAALTKEKKIIKEAQDTAKKILDDAKEQGLVVAKDIEEKAKKQADRMLEDAKNQIAIETKHAEQQLNKHISELSVALLKKSLDRVFSDKDQSEIVAKAAKEIKRAN
jgi:F-type H+-transporting ATPase subunit b